MIHTNVEFDKNQKYFEIYCNMRFFTLEIFKF